MSRETFIISDKEYAASKVSAFAANGIILKLQRLVLPVLGVMAGNGKAQVSVMDMDISDALEVISSKLDENVMIDIVMPLFKLSQVACVTDNIKLDNSGAIDKVFIDADGLADLYMLIFEVLKFNFAGFFTKMAASFGNNDGSQKTAV